MMRQFLSLNPRHRRKLWQTFFFLHLITELCSDMGVIRKQEHKSGRGFSKVMNALTNESSSWETRRDLKTSLRKLFFYLFSHSPHSLTHTHTQWFIYLLWVANERRDKEQKFVFFFFFLASTFFVLCIFYLLIGRMGEWGKWRKLASWINVGKIINWNQASKSLVKENSLKNIWQFFSMFLHNLSNSHPF